MLTPEQIAKLTPEELVIANRWERERKERRTIFDRYLSQEITSKEALNQLNKLSQFCEHNRFIYSHCSGCDAVEAKLYPERFDEDGFRKEDESP